ncbi:MAG: GAF domain-containing protein, partial [Desulfobacteraceae bacterium]|nr:GAF domain-containing protein [Desulfobacteraceae bacterium]
MMAEKQTSEKLKKKIKKLEQENSKYKQAELWKELNIKILDLINQSEIWKDCIVEILNEIKQFSGFEAVAIRLNEGEDFPYYVTNGFPAHFVEAEKYLCTRDSKGEIKRNPNGNPYLECMCGNVICGRTDTSKNFFTKDGSFWSNNTSKLLSETTDEDRQTRTRNRCNSEGYESVGLFPLRAGNEILGLLQINDMRLHQFTDDNVKFFEDIGNNIGIAFSKKRVEDELQKNKNLLLESNKILSTILNHTHILMALLDKKFNFIWVNKAYAAADQKNISFFPGKNHFDLYPHKENLAIFEKVLTTGEPLFVTAKPF